MSMAKMRVYEIAREVGLANKELIGKIRALGLEVNNHMSSLPLEDVQRVKRSLERERVENTVTKRLSKTVLRRRSKKTEEEPVAKAAASEPVATPPPTAVAKPASVAKPVAEPKVVARKKAAIAKPAMSEQETKPEPVPEVPKVAKAAKPAAVEPAPEPVVAKAAAPAPAPAPATTTTTTTTTRAPAPEAPAKVVAKAKTKKKAPVVINVPVDLPRVNVPEPVVAKPEPEPEVEAKAEPGKRRDIAGDARSRFEKELARAREQAAAREAEREAVKPKDAAEAPEARADGRPEVGAIIELPKARIKITERAPARGRSQVHGRFTNQRSGGRGRDTRRKQVRRGGGKQTQITTPAEHKRIIRMEDNIAVQDLAHHMGVKATELVRKLWTMGMVGTNINASIDHETASLMASEFGYEVQNVAFKEEEAFEAKADAADELLPRAPVVTVMGHVDHGKTSLLDYIRKTKVTAGESGGITQHIGAYRVDAGAGHGEIVFLDTPGHAAFSEMRARGAQSTDIVILVAAADDGLMPQTREAIDHAKSAGVPIIVAVNKCDLPGAQPEKVRQQASEHGLIPEEWGGDTMYVDVSALTGDGVDKLLEAVSLNAELLELKANPNKQATGVVIEAKLDRNRGPMITLLVQEGTLRVGEIVVVGDHMGKVRALMDDNGNPVTEAGPSTPVEVLGIDGVPMAGEMLNATDDEKMAKQVVAHRHQVRRKKELAQTGRISLESLMQTINEGQAAELKIVLKADVHGSSEALKQALVEQSTEKVKVNVISSGVGGITETDVNRAKAGGAIIVGFHVRPAGKSTRMADQESVEIKIYDIIYEALDDVRAAMAGLLPPIQREQARGMLEVRETFTIPRKGVVAGCMVTDGIIGRKDLIRVIRDSVQIYEGKVSSLKRFKDEAAEVREGYECGVMMLKFNDLQNGDILETYEIIEEAATL